MMRRAFIDTTKTPEPVHFWSPEAQKYIDQLQAKNEKEIADLVILSVLVPREQSMDWATEPLLDEIIESGSPWRDWAYWEKARVVSLKSCSSTAFDPWGLARYSHEGKEYVTASAYSTWQTIRGRAAAAFLKENKKSYMKDAFLGDFWSWQIGQIHDAADGLQDSEEKLGYALTNEQVESLDEISSAAARFVVEPRGSDAQHKLRQLERELDDRLWGDFYIRLRGFHIRFFRAIVEAKGKEALPSGIYEALIALDEGEGITRHR